MKILYVNPGRIEAGLDAVIKGPPLVFIGYCRHGSRT